MSLGVGVVGGGAVGLTAAHDLARRGASVTLFEAGSVGSGSTGRAAGLLSRAHADPVNAELGARAVERFRAFAAEDGDGDGDGNEETPADDDWSEGDPGFRFHEAPHYTVATEPGPRAETVRREAERKRELGCDVAIVDPAELGRSFPAVRTDDVAVAVRALGGGYADTLAYARLVARLARAAGARIREGTPAAVETDPPRVRADGDAERFDAVLVAAGAQTKRLCADAGVPLAMKPYRVQALTAGGPAVPMLHDVTAGYYLRPHPAGLLAGDGTEHVESDPDDWARDADDEFRAEMRRRLGDRLDGFDPDGGLDRAWAGLCTATPDGDPLLGELADGLYVATGWQGHGFLRAPATGEAVATQILGGDGIPAFDPGRFDDDEEFPVREGMSVEPGE